VRVAFFIALSLARCASIARARVGEELSALKIKQFGVDRGPPAVPL
jgi:hypothetical protein